MRSVAIALLLTLRTSPRNRAALHLEVLALRHQLQVVQRSRPRRVRLTRADRALWAWLSRLWDDWRAGILIVRPETVVAWHLTAPRSPWQNAYAERFIGSVRRECLDHVVVLTAAGLRRILNSYVACYTTSRTHLSLEKDSPEPRPVTPRGHGRVVAIPEVGGLHHRYERRAA